ENFLTGKDFALNKNEEGIHSLKELTFDFRVSYAGGRRYTPIDLAASLAAGETRYIDSLAWSQKFTNYFRMDVRAGFRTHGKNVTQEWAIDVQNVTDHENPLYEKINLTTGKPQIVYQLGIFPIAQYRIEF